MGKRATQGGLVWQSRTPGEPQDLWGEIHWCGMPDATSGGGICLKCRPAVVFSALDARRRQGSCVARRPCLPWDKIALLSCSLRPSLPPIVAAAFPTPNYGKNFLGGRSVWTWTMWSATASSSLAAAPAGKRHPHLPYQSPFLRKASVSRFLLAVINCVLGHFRDL